MEPGFVGRTIRTASQNLIFVFRSFMAALERLQYLFSIAVSFSHGSTNSTPVKVLLCLFSQNAVDIAATTGINCSKEQHLEFLRIQMFVRWSHSCPSPWDNVFSS